MCLGAIPFQNTSWLSLGFSEAHAAITFRNTSTAGSNGGTSIVVSMPVGTVEGDLLIATMTHGKGTDTLLAPVDWILIQPGSPGSEAMRTRSWYKVAQAGEAGPYTFSTNSSPDDLIVHVAAFYESTGVNVTGWILEDSSYVYQGTTANSITTGSVIGVANGLLYTGFVNDDNESVTTAPSGMTVLNEQLVQALSLATYYEFRGAGAVTETIAWGGGAEELSAIAVVFSWTATVSSTCSTTIFRGKSTANSNSASSLAVSMPAGTVEGDLMIATMTHGAGTGTLSAPPNWTLIQPASPGTEVMRTRSWFKVAQAGEAGPYTFTASSADDVIVHIAAFYDTRGVNVEGWTLEDSSYLYQGTTNTSVTSSSVTGGATGFLYTGFANDDNEVVLTAPSSVTLLDEQLVANLSLATYFGCPGAGAVAKTIAWGGMAEELSAIAAIFRWSSATTGGGAGGSPDTTLSWMHTIGGGSNRLLVVGVEIEDESTTDAVVNSVTYNGVGLTRAVSAVAGTTFFVNAELWYLLDVGSMPAAGTYTVTVTTTGTTDNRIGGSYSVSDMKQIAPEATNAQTSNSGPTPFNTSVTTLTDGALVFDAIVSGNPNTVFTTNQTGQAEFHNTTVGSSTGAASTKPVVMAGPTTMGWNVTGANRLAHVVAAFAPADTPTPATNLTATSFNSLSDIQWDNSLGDLTHNLVLAKTTNCNFSASPVGTEAIDSTVGNGVVLFNSDPTINLPTTSVNVGGPTTVSYTASTGRLTHNGLTSGTVYCYKVFVRNGGLLDDASGNGRPEVTVTATNGTSPNPTWSLNLESSNGATLVQPGLDPGVKIYTSFGSGTLVAMGAADGLLSWRTTPASGSIQDQSPVIPISVSGNCGAAGATDCLFATSQDGFVYAQNAATGVGIWSYRHAVGDVLQGAVAAQIKDFSDVGFTPSTDYLFVATRNVSATANKVYALNPTSIPASPSWLFTGGGATSMDMVNAAPVVDYLNNRIYVTSHSNGNTQRSLWVFNSSDGTLLSTGTTYGSTTLGDITVAPALSADSATVYVGTTGGSLQAYHTSDGSLKWTFSTVSAVVSGIWLDSSTGDLFFSTANGTVWRVSDDGGSASDVWAGSKPALTSATLPLILPGIAKVYVGGCTGPSCASGSEGRMYQVNATTGAMEECRILGTNVTVGDPAFDVVNEQLLVGANNGKIYAFSAPAGILGNDPLCIP
jgi:hypothetical protein